MFSKKNNQTDNYRNSSSFKSNKSRAEQPLANIMVWGADVSEKNPVGEKQTGNLGRNWAQAHKAILLGYIHEKKLRNATNWCRPRMITHVQTQGYHSRYLHERA